MEFYVGGFDRAAVWWWVLGQVSEMRWRDVPWGVGFCLFEVDPLVIHDWPVMSWGA